MPGEGSEELDRLEALARALAGVGRAVRDAVRSGAAPVDPTHRAEADRPTGPGRTPLTDGDAAVVREEGGDEIFGVDVRAEAALLAGLDRVGRRWPGSVVLEGFDDPRPVGDPAGPWRYLADPVDGTRPLLADTESAWVLLGAGRGATTLEELEVGAVVEIPTSRAAVGLVAWAATGGPARAVHDHLHEPGRAPSPVALAPRRGPLERSFVTVARVTPGDHGPIGAWADRHLAGLVVHDHLVPCSGGQLLAVAAGREAAVLDPRPLLRPGGLAAHPYDLAGLVVARAAGAVVEALPPGPLDIPLDPHAPVAWAAYAGVDVAERLRPDPDSLAGGGRAAPAPGAE